MTLTDDFADTAPPASRALPQDPAAERATLGGMLLSKDAIADVSEILVPADFYTPAHELIYTAILDLYADGQLADSLTVGAELTKRGELARVGGAPYLHTLVSSVATAANAGWHAVIVRDRSTQRRIIEAGTRIAAMGYATDDASDLPEIIDRAQAEAFALARPEEEQQSTMADSVARVLACLDEDGDTGLMTGFEELDELTGGLQAGQMIIVAARPAIGKSTLGLDIARHVSIRLGHDVGLFSLEMGHDEVTMRALAAEATVPLHHLRNRTATSEDLQRLAKYNAQVANAPIHVDDLADTSVMRMRTKARRLKQRHDVRLLIVDYLQLASAGTNKRHENRQTEVSAISRGLKLLAKELQIPIIAIAQLNRGPEQRTDKKPMMSDLRESGSLEQDADIVILLHREDAYEKDCPRAGEADLIVAKHRNGPTKTITVAFQGRYSRFVDMAR